MLFVRADGDDVGVDLGREIREAARGVANTNAVARARFPDRVLDVTQAAGSRLPGSIHVALVEQWGEAVQQDDLGVWREGSRRP
jgi:hypothetical protein